MATDEVRLGASATGGGGIRRLMVTHVDAAGIERARIIPAARIASALDRGVHASISSAALFTPHDEPVDAVGLDAVVGDLLARPDAGRLALIDAESQLAWAPADLSWPDGSALSRVRPRCGAAGDGRARGG